MDGLYWKTLLKWMIWGAHPYFWKHPYVSAKYGTNKRRQSIPPRSRGMSEPGMFVGGQFICKSFKYTSHVSIKSLMRWNRHASE